MQFIKQTHPKIQECIDRMLIDLKYKMPFYGEYNLMINFHEEKIGTCGVNVSSKGMQFYYDPDFMEKLEQLEVHFIDIHEIFHLLFNHPKRTVSGRFDQKLSNIAQDMIINTTIWEDINRAFVAIPKYPDTEDNQKMNIVGKNMGIFLPKEYKEEAIFEMVYMWLKDKYEEHQKRIKKNGQKNNCKTCNGTGEAPQKGKKDKNKDGGQGEGEDGEKGKPENKKGKGQGDQNQEHNHGEQGEPCPDCDGGGQNPDMDSAGNPSYGNYGKGDVDTFSLDSLFDNMEKNGGQFMDVHMEDEVPEELKEAIVRDAVERLKARGLVQGNIEQTINKLRKKRKDYLKEIKRAISNEIMGTVKKDTIVRPNRRSIDGLKGNRKMKTMINVILDTSGSMSGLVEKCMDYIYRNDIECNIIQCDTTVQAVSKMRRKKDLEKLTLRGFGGTILMPSVNKIVDEFNQYNTLLITDGYTDTLDFSKVKGRVLIITCGEKVPISGNPKKGLKQIVIDTKYY